MHEVPPPAPPARSKQHHQIPLRPDEARAKFAIRPRRRSRAAVVNASEEAVVNASEEAVVNASGEDPSDVVPSEKKKVKTERMTQGHLRPVIVEPVGTGDVRQKNLSYSRIWDIFAFLLTEVAKYSMRR